MKIVVIGGTGLIGSKLVSALRAMGHGAVAASPDTGVNTLTRYFGAPLGERTLTSDSPNIVGTMPFADWVALSKARAPIPRAASATQSAR
jgi:hypothetical protein